MITKLKKLRANGSEEGFTLIELMIVVVIIGILAAIAIPVFANQQTAAVNASLQADIRNTNGNIVSTMSQMPQAGRIDGSATGANGTYGLYKDGADATPAHKGVIIVSDKDSTVNVAGAWDSYTIIGYNMNTGAKFSYDANTGKTDKSMLW